MQTRRRTGPDSHTVDAILERAQYSCEICSSGVGDRRGIDWSIHHRRARKMGGTRWAGINGPSNLMLLCGSGVTGCHGVVESNRTVATARGWLVQSHEDPSRVMVLITCEQWERWVYLTAEATYADAPAVVA